MRMSKKQKLAAVILAVLLAGTSMLLVYASGGPYNDVNPFNAHYDSIVYAYEQGLLTGFGEEYFEPDRELTRAEFTVLLGRTAEAAGLSIPDSAASRFADVDGSSWYNKYVNWASRKGILTGVGGDHFDPEGTLTREEASALALNFLALIHVEAEDGYVGKHKDLDEVSFWYRDEVNQAIAARVAIGYRDKQLEPAKPVTRGDMAELIHTLGTVYLKNGLNLTEVLDIYVPIIAELPVNRYDKASIITDGSVKSYQHGDVSARIGIDVSVHQGEIDWPRVSRAGIEFAMIRVGGRGYSSGQIYDDERFAENMSGAVMNGVPVGAYFFSQAVTVEEAREEAYYVLSKIRNYPVSYPVVFDWEEISTADARTDSVTTETLTECAQVFSDIIADAGYIPVVYANRALALLHYDLRGIQQYGFWVAEYNELPSYYYDFQMWQYTDSGRVDGIKGNVDMNLSFVDYANR